MHCPHTHWIKNSLSYLSQVARRCAQATGWTASCSEGALHWRPEQLRELPDARVRGVRPQLPALPIEGDTLDEIQVDAFETTGVDHVVGGIRSRTIEGGNAAVTAELVKRALGAELIRRKISLPSMRRNLSGVTMWWR